MGSFNKSYVVVQAENILSKYDDAYYKKQEETNQKLKQQSNRIKHLKKTNRILKVIIAISAISFLMLII